MMKKPEESLADCHSLLQILDEEYKGSASALTLDYTTTPSRLVLVMVIRLEQALVQRGDISQEL
ncbi:hypothetical protein BGZ60DRAFT_404026 [Tricladium varicosporioides]|nr:hypothetical protein BGZ60DRAFT_404026 [Hymenoscyphus varicosporioides]